MAACHGLYDSNNVWNVITSPAAYSAMNKLTVKIACCCVLVDAFIPDRRDGDRNRIRCDTLIRHALLPLTFAVGLLMVPVIEPALQALPMFAVGFAQLAAAARLTAAIAAVAMSTITTPTYIKDCATIPGTTIPLSKNDFAASAHPTPRGGLDKRTTVMPRLALLLVWRGCLFSHLNPTPTVTAVGVFLLFNTRLARRASGPHDIFNFSNL